MSASYYMIREMIVSMPQRKTLKTAEEYLEIERAATEKSEFYKGECFAMAGASRRHNILSLNMATGLHRHLRNKPCQPYMADMRLHIEAHDHYTYPDILVVCDERAYVEEDIVNDATVIAEVLSPSTESYDRGKKFLHYQSLPSLQEYILISQETMLVEIYQRRDNGEWLYHALSEPVDKLHISSIEFSCLLSELYESLLLIREEAKNNN